MDYYRFSFHFRLLAGGWHISNEAVIPESFGDRVVGIDADMKQSIEDIFRWARLMPLPNQKRGKFVPGPEAVGTTRLDKASVKAGAEGKKLMGSGFAKGGRL